MTGCRSAPPLESLLLSLLLPALCCVPLQAQLSEDGCFYPQLNTTLSVGEQRVLPNCGGLITCTSRLFDGLVQHDGCLNPDANICRRLEPSEAGPDAPFPRCCPRITCKGCYSERLDRYFGAGESWTERHCVRRTCKAGRSGTIDVIRETCKPLGEPPSFDDCELVGPDMTRGEYPLCCAYYRCPGRCLYKNERWLSTAQEEITNRCTVQQALAQSLIEE